MPQERLSMRKIKEVLRLKNTTNLSNRDIGKSCNISKTSVAQYIDRAEKAGIAWPLPEQLDEETLEQMLFPSPKGPSPISRPTPDWKYIHTELRKKGVTLFLLWEEYKQIYPQGYQYSRFCQLYNKWEGKLDKVMRQNHRAGEKMFVDYAGQTVEIQDKTTGEIRSAQIFIAVLGASNYTFAEATWTQTLPDWISSHVKAFKFFQGVPEIVVPDNLKSGVTKAHMYEPDINPTYQEMANHYQVAIIPARNRAPKDKAKVEVGVQIVERWILAKLRNRRFFSLAELNREISQLLGQLNQKSFQKMPGSRESLYHDLDKPALRSLPDTDYEFALWKKVRVNIDYHVEVDKHYYSVPHQLIKKQLEARITAKTIEIFHKGKRVASHIRSFQKGRHTTFKEHMPKAHRQYAEWTPEKIIQWARKTGPNTALLVKKILDSKPIPQQGFRTCLGILRLGKGFGQLRLEKACIRALKIGATTYKSVESILKNGLDQSPLPNQEKETEEDSIIHENIRGKDYYN